VPIQASIRLETLNLPFREAVDRVRGLGVELVEIDAVGEFAPDQLSQTGRRQVVHLLSSRGLRLAALSAPTRQGLDEPTKREPRLEYLMSAMRLAWDLGARVITHQGAVIPSAEETRADAELAETLTRLSHHVDRVGVRYAMETVAAPPEAYAAFFARHPLPGIGVCYLPANVMVRGGIPAAGVRALHDRLLAMRVRDVVRTGSTISGFKDAAVGAGELRWPELLAAIDEVGFTGPLTIDLAEGDRTPANLEAAITFLKSF
jgi:sugar phosphate isomerase/epimerase